MTNPKGRSSRVEGGTNVPNADASASCARYDAMAAMVNRTGTYPEAVSRDLRNEVAFYVRHTRKIAQVRREIEELAKEPWL